MTLSAPLAPNNPVNSREPIDSVLASRSPSSTLPAPRHCRIPTGISGVLKSGTQSPLSFAFCPPVISGPLLRLSILTIRRKNGRGVAAPPGLRHLGQRRCESTAGAGGLQMKTSRLAPGSCTESLTRSACPSCRAAPVSRPLPVSLRYAVENGRGPSPVPGPRSVGHPEQPTGKSFALGVKGQVRWA